IAERGTGFLEQRDGSGVDDPGSQLRQRREDGPRQEARVPAEPRRGHHLFARVPALGVASRAPGEGRFAQELVVGRRAGHEALTACFVETRVEGERTVERAALLELRENVVHEGEGARLVRVAARERVPGSLEANRRRVPGEREGRSGGAVQSSTLRGAE